MFELFGCEVSWCAAAPMELNHGTILRNAAADALHLSFQHVKIGRRDVLVLLNDDVARAKKAEAFTKGNMHVERNRRPGTLGLFVHPFEVRGAKSVVPDRCRGVACIARPRAIVFCEEILADVEFAAHLLQALVCDGHAWSFLLHLRGGSCIENERALAPLGNELDVLC